VVRGLNVNHVGRSLNEFSQTQNREQETFQDNSMADTENMELYKEEVTERGAMKIEVVLEEAKKKKRPASARSRPGSSTSVCSMEDIERRQQV
jgi:hypothetical protein